MKRNNLIGQTFNRLTVIELAGVNNKQNLMWRCICTCGGVAIAPAYDLRNGKVKSCGCLVREGSKTTHGMARSGSKRSRVYSVWAAMISRCCNPNDRSFANYGGRGIRVCKRWKKFDTFFADMGAPEVGQSLDRIDNEKGYTPKNCRWASTHEQARNKRSSVWVVINGTRYILKDALLLLGVSREKFYYHQKKYNQTHQEVLDKWLQQKKEK